VSAIGFIAASLGFLGFIVPNEWWRQLAIASSLVSLTGLILFIETGRFSTRSQLSG